MTDDSDGEKSRKRKRWSEKTGIEEWSRRGSSRQHHRLIGVCLPTSDFPDFTASLSIDLLKDLCILSSIELCEVKFI